MAKPTKGKAKPKQIKINCHRCTDCAVKKGQLCNMVKGGE